MAGTRDPIPERVSKEATDWLILLQEEPEDGELRRRFMDWLQRSPANAWAWEETRETVASMDGGTPAHGARWEPLLLRLRAEGDRPAEAVRSAAGRAAEAPSGRIRQRKLLRLAGLAAAASLLIAALLSRTAMQPQADHATGTAEIRTVQLADGSLVMLAPESAVRVALDGTGRRVELLRGEAFFEVAPDAGLPFRVSSDAVEITVLGTGFEVRQADDGTEVAVAHGSVRVDYGESSPPVAQTLETGETARVARAGEVSLGRMPANQIAAWRNDQLIARDQALGAVVDRLRPYYSGAIVVTDSSLAEQPVTGLYDLTDPLAALRAIARAQQGVVRQITPWILLISPS